MTTYRFVFNRFPVFLAKTPEDESEHMPPDDEGAEEEGLEEEEVPPPVEPPKE